MNRNKRNLGLIMLGSALIMLACSQGILSGVSAAISTPAPSESYTWRVLDTNGQVWWWVTSDRGYAYFNQNGTISYNLTGQDPADVPWGTITGNVWFGDVAITLYNSSTQSQDLNKTILNCSSTETGAALAISIKNWHGGLVAPANWQANLAMMQAETASDPAAVLEYYEFGPNVVIEFQDANQVTSLAYDAFTSVLLYVDTSFFGFELEMVLEGIALDRDDDGLPDSDELIYSTDPINPDSDGDGYSDGQEIAGGTDPNSPNDFPWTPGIPIHPLPIVLFTALGFVISAFLVKKKLRVN